MKPFILAATLVLVSAALAPAQVLPAPRPPAAETRLFELREYYAAPGKLDALHGRFRESTVKLLEKHGIASVAYFTTEEGETGKLCAILAYADAATRARAWEGFVTDPEWQRARRAADANGRLVQKIREHPLTPTPGCPAVKADGAKAAGLRYELQSLTILASEVAAACDRLCNAPHSADATVVGCWTTPVAGSPTEVRIVRLVARPPVAATGTRTVAFRLDPVTPAKWSVEPDDVTFVTIAPTDYSPLK